MSKKATSVRTGPKISTARSKVENVNKTGVTGVYGAHPTLPEYKQSMGKDTVPTKFAEGSIGTTKRGSTPKSSAAGNSPKPFGSTVSSSLGKSTVITGKNNYARVYGKAPLKGKK